MSRALMFRFQRGAGSPRSRVPNPRQQLPKPNSHDIFRWGAIRRWESSQRKAFPSKDRLTVVGCPQRGEVSCYSGCSSACVWEGCG